MQITFLVLQFSYKYRPMYRSATPPPPRPPPPFCPQSFLTTEGSVLLKSYCFFFLNLVKFVILLYNPFPFPSLVAFKCWLACGVLSLINTDGSISTTLKTLLAKILFLAWSEGSGVQTNSPLYVLLSVP